MAKAKPKAKPKARTTKKKAAPKRNSATKTAKKSTTKSSKATTKRTTKKKAATKKKVTKKSPAKSSAKGSTKSKAKSDDTEVKIDRRTMAKEDRREDEDRRQEVVAVDKDQRSNPERRSKVARRRQIDPTTCERDYTNDEIEFMHALDEYKRKAGRMFPTCSEILEVVRDLGYRRLNAEEIAKLGPIVDPAEAEVNAEGVEGEDGFDSESQTESVFDENQEPVFTVLPSETNESFAEVPPPSFEEFEG